MHAVKNTKKPALPFYDTAVKSFRFILSDLRTVFNIRLLSFIAIILLVLIYISDVLVRAVSSGNILMSSILVFMSSSIVLLFALSILKKIYISIFEKDFQTADLKYVENKSSNNQYYIFLSCVFLLNMILLFLTDSSGGVLFVQLLIAKWYLLIPPIILLDKKQRPLNEIMNIVHKINFENSVVIILLALVAALIVYVSLFLLNITIVGGFSILLMKNQAFVVSGGFLQSIFVLSNLILLFLMLFLATIYSRLSLTIYCFLFNH